MISTFPSCCSLRAAGSFPIVPPITGNRSRSATAARVWDSAAALSPQVQDTSFVLCIVYVQPEIPVKQLKNLNTAPSSKLLYHRLDLLGQPSSCLHFKQLATVGKAVATPLPTPPPRRRALAFDSLRFPFLSQNPPR